MRFRWSPAKPAILKANNRPSFDEVVKALSEGLLIEEIANPKYPGQIILIVELPPRKIFCAVPTTQNGDEFYFHTVYPSEKYTKKYKKKGVENG
jgi:hypothetical protein